MPRHRPQLDRELERKLEGVLGRPVEVSLRELLTADEKALASEQASLAQLRESVLRLQSVAERDAAQRSAGTRASEAMHQRVLAHFGQLEILEGGQRARWQLNGTAGLDIVEARRLELARRYVLHSQRDLAEVALLLGFSCPSAFSRWHAAQFGTTGAAARRSDRDARDRPASAIADRSLRPACRAPDPGRE